MTFRTTFRTLAVSIFIMITTNTALAVMPDGQPTVTPAPISSGPPSEGQPGSTISRRHKPDELLIKFKEGVQGNVKLGVQNSLNSGVRADSGRRPERHWSRAHGLGVSKARHFESLKKKDKRRKHRKRKHRDARLDSWWHVKLPEGTDLQQAMATIAADPSVELVEPNYELQVFLTPDDPFFGNLWGMQNVQQSGGLLDADIDAPEAWDNTTGDPNVVVAVIDTGVDYTHEDLAANMWVNPGEIPGNGIDDDGNGFVDDIHGYDFVNDDNDPADDFGHGTHCAGTIAGVGNNGVGVAGVSWNAKIMALKFLGSNGYGTYADAIEAIIYATNNGARIMSNSWGGDGFSQAMLDAINAANDAGVLFVAAAGNRYRDNDIRANYPSNFDAPNVIAVAATDHNDNKAAFSDWGAISVDLGAPGVGVYSAVPTGSCKLCSSSGYQYLNGTSMATPHVSGAAALLLAWNPGFTVDDLKTLLLNSVDPIPSMAGITTTGGRLNIASAITANVDFSAAASPASQSALAGDTVTYNITVESRGATTQPISLSLGTLDSELSANLADDVLTPPVGGTATTTLTVTAGANAPRGDYNIVLSARDEMGRLVGNKTVQLTVLYPDYTLTLTPTETVVAVGGAEASFDISIASIDDYSGPLDLSVATSDSLIAASISPSTITLPANGTASAHITVTADANAPSQIYTLTASAAGGASSKSADAQINVVDTDLAVSDVTASVSEIDVGGTMTINTTITNQGDSPATASRIYVGYYLSADTNVDTNDTYLKGYVLYSLGGNSSVDLSQSVTVPTGLQSGAYHVGVIVDYKDGQPEADETNNALVATDTLQVNQAVDLVPTELNVPTGSLLTGSGVTLNATVANQGSASSRAFFVGFYLSTDAVITTADKYIGSYSAHLSSGEVRNFDKDVSLPADFVPGDYYFGMIVDYRDDQPEKDESNNTLAAGPYPLIQDVDFTLTAFSAPEGDYYTGSSVRVNSTFLNQGASNTYRNYYVGYYLSTDATITAEDTHIGSSGVYGTAAGSTHNLYADANIPWDLAPGTYYIGALADYYNTAAETDESNNTMVAGTRLVIRDIDLVLTDFGMPAGDITAGASVPLSVSLANQGNSTTWRNFFVGYYLSTDATITTADTPLGSTIRYGFKAGDSVDYTKNVTTPAGLTPGSYYIGTIVDYGDYVPETDESNNVSALPVTIVQ